LDRKLGLLKKRLKAQHAPEPEGVSLKRFRMAPSDHVEVIPQDHPQQAKFMQWGLIPHWAKPEKVKSRTLPPPINARAETVADKPTFRDAFYQHRCLVPASWYFEWAEPEPGRKSKQPYKIRPEGQEEFAFAAICSPWQTQPETEPLWTFSLVTVPAAESIAHLHDRMPLILKPGEEEELWVNEACTAFELEQLMRPYEEPMEFYPINTQVNNPRNDTPEILNPPGQEGLFG